jgi:lysophospholipase L1-like esterase
MTAPHHSAPPDPASPPPGGSEEPVGWRRVGRAFGLIGVGLVVALAVAEALLRLSGLAPPQGTIFTVDQAAFERIPGIFEPGPSRTIREVPGLSYRASINDLGYRGAPLARQPEPDEVRILFIGDSVIFGSFVDDDETLPARIEGLLSDRCGAPVRTVNAGLEGSTIRDHVEIVQRSLDIDPHLIVVTFSENDIRELIGPSMWLQLEDNRRTKSGFPLRHIYPVARHTALWNLALRVRTVLRQQQVDSELTDGAPIAPDGIGASADDSPLVGTARERYRTLLAGLREAMATAGIPIVFAIYPSHLTVYGGWDSDQHEWATAMGRELGLPTLSFLEPIARDGRPDSVLYLLPQDGRPSAEGYRITAEYLENDLALMEPLATVCS